MPSTRAYLARTLASGAIALLVVVAVAATVRPAAADAQDGACANDAFRTGHAAQLPDCRAYEQVSPLAADPLVNTFNPTNFRPSGARASDTGDAFGYFSWVNTPGVESFGHYFLSTRGEDVWSTQGLIPPQSTHAGNLCTPRVDGYSADLSKAVLADGEEGESASGPLCGVSDPPLVAGAPEGFQNLFVRDNRSGSYELVNVTPDGVDPTDAYFQAGSWDLDHVFFNEAARLTPNAPDGRNLYAWKAGSVRLVTVLPDGTPASGSLGNENTQDRSPGEVLKPRGGATYTHAVSADGTRAFFQAGGNLYLRENPAQEQSPLDGDGQCTDPALACTIQIDRSQGSGPGGGGTFFWATPDGAHAFFTASASADLTDDTIVGSGPNLYRYDIDTGDLVNLTPAGDVEVLGMSGVSDDGSRVYFVAEGALAPEASAGQPNLYLHRASGTTLVATLAATDVGPSDSVPYEACDWTPACLTARVSSDGRFVAFNSTESLTGYDNVPADPAACDTSSSSQPSGAPCPQIYLYDAEAQDLRCASCDPSGAPPTGEAWIRRPTHLQTLNQYTVGYIQRHLADDGRLFFDSPDALLPSDVNGKQDVYQYDEGGLSLLSSGTSTGHSYFFDAGASGDDVFLATTEDLLPTDTDSGYSIYDARVGGGFAAPEPPAPPCQGEGCQGELSEPPASTPPGSGEFDGPGNQAGGRGDPDRCERIASKAHRAKRKVVRTRRQLHRRRHEVKQLRRKLRHADGRHRARRLRHLIERARGELRHARKQARQAKRGQLRAKQRAGNCRRAGK